MVVEDFLNATAPAQRTVCRNNPRVRCVSQWSNARWYDPAAQRWLTEDPSGLGPDSNPYRYVGNDPTNETDPTGLSAASDDNDLFNAQMGIMSDAMAKMKSQLAAVGAQLGQLSDPSTNQVGISNADVDGIGFQLDRWVQAWESVSNTIARGNISAADRLAYYDSPTPGLLGLNWLAIYPNVVARVVGAGQLTAQNDATHDARMVALATGLQIGSYVGDAAGVVSGGFAIKAAAECGGKWAVAKLVATAGTAYLAGQAADYGARKLGASEQTIGYIHFASAVVGLILLHRSQCFVAGTQVVLPAERRDRDESAMASALGDDPPFLAAAIAALALAGTAVKLRRKKRPGPAGPDGDAEDLIFGSQDEMDSILDSGPEAAFDDGCTALSSASSAPRMCRNQVVASPPDARAAAGSWQAPSGASHARGSVEPRSKDAWAKRLWIAGWLLVAGCLAYAGLSRGSSAPAESPAVTSTDAPSTKSIEELHVGDRVLADNPDVADAKRQQPDPDPVSWLHLTLQMAEADGGTLDIELLRPRQWVDQRRADPGRTISMDLSEMGAVGAARVLAVGPCPPIKNGAGRVVTGTFAHAASNVIDVRLDGMDEPIGCTANHRFWSENRQAFVSAGELSVGERLRSADGTTLRVAEIKPRPVAERVYNIEVDVEHTYYVSRRGVLVHNMCAEANSPRGTLPREPNGNYIPDPEATGPHSTLGERVRPSGPEPPYRQGATFDENGNYLGRTDVTDHGRPSTHPNPHFHSATSPNSEGPAEPIPGG